VPCDGPDPERGLRLARGRHAVRLLTGHQHAGRVHLALPAGPHRCCHLTVLPCTYSPGVSLRKSSLKNSRCFCCVNTVWTSGISWACCQNSVMSYQTSCVSTGKNSWLFMWYTAPYTPGFKRQTSAKLFYLIKEFSRYFHFHQPLKYTWNCGWKRDWWFQPLTNAKGQEANVWEYIDLPKSCFWERFWLETTATSSTPISTHSTFTWELFRNGWMVIYPVRKHLSFRANESKCDKMCVRIFSCGKLYWILYLYIYIFFFSAKERITCWLGQQMEFSVFMRTLYSW